MGEEEVFKPANLEGMTALRPCLHSWF